MLLGSVFDRFVNQSPLTVMARGLLEQALVPAELDALFERTAERQYTRDLLFSTTVDLMSLVVTGIRSGAVAPFGRNKGKMGSICGLRTLGSGKRRRFSRQRRLQPTGPRGPRLLRVKGCLHDSV